MKPKIVRNFWIEATVDGSEKKIGSGPRSKDGGFVLTVYQRSEGGVSTALRVQGNVSAGGELLYLYVSPDEMSSIEPYGRGFKVTTKR